MPKTTFHKLFVEEGSMAVLNYVKVNCVQENNPRFKVNVDRDQKRNAYQFSLAFLSHFSHGIIRFTFLTFHDILQLNYKRDFIQEVLEQQHEKITHLKNSNLPASDAA